MTDLLNFNMLIELMLAISLSAAAGFRVFVPLLVLSGAAVLGHFDLPANLDWAESQPALIVFGIACLLEIGGYYIPWFDHILDIVATPAAILTGTFVTASLVNPDLDPLVQWTLALIAGGGTAGVTKGLMNIFRGGSTAASGGLTNPLFSTFELIAAIILSVLAITIPIATGFLVITTFGIAMRKLWMLLAHF